MIEECKDEVAKKNNFDSFKRAVRYTFNRKLLQSEEEFLNKIINESMQLYAKQSSGQVGVDTAVDIINKWEEDAILDEKKLRAQGYEFSADCFHAKSEAFKAVIRLINGLARQQT
jgi:hypothetical protein